MQPSFTIEQPRSVADAVELLAERDDQIRPLGGGTGLTLLMRYGFFEPVTLVSLQRLGAELAGIEATSDGGLRVGAMTTLRDLEVDSRVREGFPLLAQALGRLASVRVRNVAQVGGAVAHGHPQMDVPPVLLATEATVSVTSTDGTRSIPASQLFHGYYETDVQPGELITHLEFPALPAAARSTYRKITARTVDDWPALGVAVVGATVGGEVSHLRIALGAIADRPLRLVDVEAAVVGEPVSEATLHEAAEDAAAALDYHDSATGSAAYQRHLVAVHLRRALVEVLLGSADGKGGR